MEFYKFSDPTKILNQYKAYIDVHILNNSNVYDHCLKFLPLLGKLYSKPINHYEELNLEFDKFKNTFLNLHNMILSMQKTIDFTFYYQTSFVDLKDINIHNMIPTTLIIRYKKEFFEISFIDGSVTKQSLSNSIIPTFLYNFSLFFETERLSNLITYSIYKKCVFNESTLNKIFRELVLSFEDYKQYEESLIHTENNCFGFSTYIDDDRIDFIQQRTVNNNYKNNIIFYVFYKDNITNEIINQHPLLKYYQAVIYSNIDIDYRLFFDNLNRVIELKEEIESF